MKVAEDYRRRCDPLLMSSLFEYVPHPHIALRKAAGPPKVAAAVAQVHGPGPIGRLNAKVGLKITLIVGTMWAAYLFAAIAFVSLPSTIKTHSPTVLVLWLSSEFIQLVLLPIIIVGQNIQSRAADARAAKTFEDVEDARKKVEHAIDLLDVHTEGGLHDAVTLIIDAINEKRAAPGGAPA